MRDTCFQLNGFPDWYQQYKAQKEGANSTTAEVSQSSPFDLIDTNKTKQDYFVNILQGLQHELDKLKGQVQSEGHIARLAQTHEYTGNIIQPYNIATGFNTSVENLNEIGPNSWVIDTGATMHMCANHILFDKLNQIPRYVTVKLPDNIIKQVTHEGNVNLNTDLHLKNVLYVPSFKFNLISVHKLTSATQASFIFYPTYCLLQDQRTKQILLKGRAVGSLYVFDNAFMINVITSCTNILDQKGI